MTSHRSSMRVGQEAWSEYLREVFKALGLPEDTVTENLKSSVAMYCQQYHPQGVQRHELMLLLARAFCAINDKPSASRVLRSAKPHAKHIDRWLEILSELHHFPELLPYFSLGIIRPADWAGARLDRMWILDLGRLALSDSEKHEIMLFRSLRSLIESMFVFWDGTAGEGVLGVKGLEAFQIGADSKPRQTFSTAADLLGYIQELFMRQKDERRWKTTPVIMNLDL